jgi:two-component system sensor histidine kinase/response regulator
MSTCITMKETQIYENISKTKRCGEIWTHTTLTPILDQKGNVSKLVAIDTDISEVKQGEERLRKANVKLTEANHELSELNKKKNEFLGIAAHDLRSPLACISSFSDLLLRFLEEDRRDPALWKRFLGNIRSTSKQMSGLVDSLLDVTAIESGRLELDILRMKLNELLQECETLHSESANAKSINLTIEASNDEVEVETDKMRIGEVLDNLVGNAIKFTHPEGKVRVSSETNESEVVISVADTGQGLNDSELGRVFTGKKLSARPTGGETSTGLGLVIVKKILELHGSRIWIESKKGVGTTFHFSLKRVLERDRKLTAGTGLVE